MPDLPEKVLFGVIWWLDFFWPCRRMFSVLELREVWAGYPIPSELVVVLPEAVLVGLFSPGHQVTLL